MNTETEEILYIYMIGVRNCFPIQGKHSFEWSSNTANPDNRPPAYQRCGCGKFTYEECTKGVQSEENGLRL